MTGLILPPSITQTRCNIFGDHINGAKIVLGGQADPRHEKQQWYCPNVSIGRYRMECEHGHKGQVMQLCKSHLNQFAVGKVSYCPKCNAEPATTDELGNVLSDTGHKCALSIKEIS